MVYSCSYFVMPTLRQEIGKLFYYSQSKWITTAYDANTGDGWEDKTNLIILKEEIFPQTNIIFLNESEAFNLTKIDSAEKSINYINLNKSTVVIIKLGKRGSILCFKEKLFLIPAFSTSEPIADMIKAGNAFQTAFMFFI